MVCGAFTKDKKVVFVAGPKSHGYFSHEHIAGCKLLAKHLNAAKVGLKSKRIVAVTQAKTADSLSYFVELLASTEAGATVLIQARVNELEDGQLGLISFQMMEGG